MGTNRETAAAIRSSGQANFVAVAGLVLFALLHPLVGIEIPFIWAALMILTAALLAYASIVVIIASRDLDRYGSLLIYEALLRFAAAGLLFVVTFFVGWWGILTFLAGLGDLVWAVRYCTMVPQATGRSVQQLLTFSESSPAGTTEPAVDSHDIDLAYRI
ncbi:MAG: hypothetical protein MJE66_02455 [Proteobacteria bacterium]|nr:hypothetical protein [Pseudomonadota bacterium]